jgi:LPXTG-site transpeptidase (sortase) family protein
MRRNTLLLTGVLLICLGVYLLGAMVTHLAASNAAAAAAQDALLGAEAVTVGEPDADGSSGYSRVWARLWAARWPGAGDDAGPPLRVGARRTPDGQVHGLRAAGAEGDAVGGGTDRRSHAPPGRPQEVAGGAARRADVARLVDAGGEPAPARPPPGTRVATLAFSRVIAKTYAVIEGTDPAALQQGPGRYRSSALPGQAGNFAIAGHRSSHGAPFADIDRLRSGDQIYVTDESGTRFTYRVIGSRIVSPKGSWAISSDPLGRGRPLLTLTTCHPRYSSRQRLIVWAELEPPSGA